MQILLLGSSGCLLLSTRAGRRSTYFGHRGKLNRDFFSSVPHPSFEVLAFTSCCEISQKHVQLTRRNTARPERQLFGVPHSSFVRNFQSPARKFEVKRGDCETGPGVIRNGIFLVSSCSIFVFQIFVWDLARPSQNQLGKLG